MKQLDRYLVAPWKSRVHDDDRIIFVPTSSLYGIPFAALIDSSSGRFLVQDHPLGLAPSASQFIAAVERDREISVGPSTNVLLVGNPNFNRRSFSSLPSLPGTAREIEQLSETYRGLSASVLMRSDATPARVLASIRRTDIVHLAVHAVVDLEDPMRSGFVLSSENGASGYLSARDIVRLRLTRTRLVVMAACDTQAGTVSASEGSLSLSSAFLAAGVPAVVGSLWKVNDDATARLFVRFHQELRRGADALSALRTAQLQELGGTDWTWASFEVFGGAAERMP